MKSARAVFGLYLAFIAYLLFVILFGAWVRITHSGAGCGDHWPTCHGEIIPFQPSTETIIEFTHRLTSGALGIMVLILLFFVIARKSKPAIIATIVAGVFIVIEALIGAGIVLKELVADDASVARAVIIAIHLVNTLVLTGAAAIGAYHIAEPSEVKQSGSRWLGVAILAGLVVVSMSGAVTALGDTLFPIAPPTSSSDGWQHLIEAFGSDQHFLIQLRGIHPLVAIVVSLFGIACATWVRVKHSDPITYWSSTVLSVMLLAQLFGGAINIALAAPGWMQLTHLLMAQLTWLAALLMTVRLSGLRPAV